MLNETAFVCYKMRLDNREQDPKSTLASEAGPPDMYGIIYKENAEERGNREKPTT